MQVLSTCDPYTTPAAVFQPIKTAEYSKMLNMKHLRIELSQVYS